MMGRTVTFIGGPLDLQRHVLDVEMIRIYRVPVVTPMTAALVHYDELIAPAGPLEDHVYDILRVPCYHKPDPAYIGVWREKWG